MNFREKAIFIWNDEIIGDAQYITELLIDAGFEAAYLHYQNLSGWRSASRVALAGALQAAGIRVYGAAAVYGADPKKEGQQAAQIVEDYNLDGFVFDAESSFDAKPTPDSNAVHMLTTYKSITAKPCAWCWWPFYKSPKTGGGWHPVNVLRAAMDYADAGIPMAYWWMGDSPAQAVDFLEKTWSQWREVTDKPIVPAGRAYVGDQGTAKPDAVIAFEARARELGAAGITWWSMEHAVKLPGVWEALAATPGYDQGSEEPMDWTKNAIGFISKTAQESHWENSAFHFVIGYAGGDWSRRSDGSIAYEPNQQLKPIELKAREKNLPLIMLWDFDVDWYARGMYGPKDELWPSEETDYPLQSIIGALKNRRFDGLIIRMMNRKNYDGGDEMMTYVAFAARKFVDRVNTWMTSTKGDRLWTIVLTCDPFLRQEGAQESFYAWIKPEFPAVGIEQGAPTLRDNAFPGDAETPGAVGNTSWKFWYYWWPARKNDWKTEPKFMDRSTGLVIFNGDADALKEFLGVGATEPDLIPPSAPTNLIAAVSSQAVTLSWSAATDNVGVVGYGVWRNGAYLSGVGRTSFTDSSMPPGTYNYEVDAYDAQGNHSPRVMVSVVIGTPDGGGEVSRVEFEAALARLAELERWRRS